MANRRRKQDAVRFEKLVARRRSYETLRNIRRELRKTARSSASSAHSVCRTPASFSFIDNPDQVVRFVNRATMLARRGKLVFFDLEHVKDLSSDAVTILLALTKSNEFRNADPKGSSPNDAASKKILEASGFMDQMAIHKPITTPLSGRMVTYNSKLVLSAEAREVRRFATKMVLGIDKPYRAIQETIIDCMSNSSEHAKPGEEGARKWHMNVYFDPSTKVCKFSFVDLGVGIIASLKSRDRSLFDSIMLRSTSEASLIRSIVSGAIGSRTNEPNRGKGLPRIYRYFKAGKIQRLIIVTNSVYANFETGRFERLSQPFKGTFVYWELRPII